MQDLYLYVNYIFDFLRNDTTNHHVYNLTDAVHILCDPHFNHFLPTVIYIHGWTESPASLSIQTVVGAYLQTKKWNTIILDWQTLASPAYEDAINNVAPVCKI